MSTPHALPGRDALEDAARAVLDDDTYAYYVSGAGDERSVADNLAAWARRRFRPRTLVDVRDVATATSVVGQPVAMPLLLAPCAFNGWAHPDAEAAVTRAAARSGTIPIVSQSSSLPFDAIARAADGPKWFQCYVGADERETAERLRAVVDAGFTAIVVTVDAPVGGMRERGMSRFGAAQDASAFATSGNVALWPGLDWDAMARLRSSVDVPLLVKGVLHPADVEFAVEHGLDGVIVSNHGARQLEGVVATADALPDLVAAAAGRLDVIVDGGVRDGRDVLRALALGATAAAIGRPYLWALALGGEDGVVALLERFRTELHNAMALTGQTDASAVAPDIVVEVGPAVS